MRLKANKGLAESRPVRELQRLGWALLVSAIVAGGCAGEAADQLSAPEIATVLTTSQIADLLVALPGSPSSDSIAEGDHGPQRAYVPCDGSVPATGPSFRFVTVLAPDVLVNAWVYTSAADAQSEYDLFLGSSLDPDRAVCNQQPNGTRRDFSSPSVSDLGQFVAFQARNLEIDVQPREFIRASRANVQFEIVEGFADAQSPVDVLHKIDEALRKLAGAQLASANADSETDFDGLSFCEALDVLIDDELPGRTRGLDFRSDVFVPLTTVTLGSEVENVLLRLANTASAERALLEQLARDTAQVAAGLEDGELRFGDLDRDIVPFLSDGFDWVGLDDEVRSRCGVDFLRREDPPTSVVGPTIADHWHVGVELFDCGIPVGPLPPTPNRAGIVSTGDGVIHVAPFNSSATGADATLGLILEALDRPFPLASRGCGDDRAELVVATWRLSSGGSWELDTTYTSDYAAIRFLRDLEFFTIGTVVEGEHPPEPSSELTELLQRESSVGHPVSHAAEDG
ncbi:MAG: hypothetical protein R8F63_02920 [Acidimicrobiales bacterium]|nr:hypothetical protein [Acidimicrobiales bacterium]